MPQQPLLEVLVTGPGDVAGAVEGGADRLLVARDPEVGGLVPAAALLRAVVVESELPVRAVLRAADSWSTTGSELTSLAGAAYELAAAGADGFRLGFLGPTLEVDLAATEQLVGATQGLPWTFSRAVDATLDHDRSWRQLRDLPGLDSVLTAGSTRGLDDGLDAVCRRAARDERAARLTLAGGGLLPEHVPWLVRAGVRGFAVGSRVRPERSAKAYVDPAYVRSWRTLLDDALAAVP